MNHKPLFIASTIVTLLAAMALESGGLSAGQAIAAAAPAVGLAMWSFNAQLFLDTLAKILSKKHNCEITVKIVEDQKEVGA